MTSDRADLFLKVLNETNDPFAAIRAVREAFGLSLAEAKELWLQTTGQAGSLDEYQQKLAESLGQLEGDGP